MLQGTYSAMTVISISFFVQAYQRFGIDKMVITLIVMACAITSILMQPVWGYIADKYNRPREIVIISSTIGAALYFAMFAFSHRLWMVLICAMGIYGSYHCMMHLIDSWIAKLMIESPGINYGATRSIGSITYALTAVVFGVAVSRFGGVIAPFVFFLLNLLLCYVALGMPNPADRTGSGQGDDRRRGGISVMETLGYLSTNKPFVIFVVAGFLNAFCTSTMGTFYSIAIFELGGNEASVGLGYFIMAIFEFPFMFLFNAIKKRLPYSNAFYLALASLFYFLKCFSIASSRSVTAVLLSGLFHGLAFGIYLPATIAYLVEHVDQKKLSTAQMVLSSIGFSLGSIVVSPISGVLSVRLGTQPMLRIISVFSLLSAAILAFASYYSKSKETTRNER